MYFLQCPFEEKDKVKSLGAKWNREERSWFVPPEFYDRIAIFNRWKPNGRIFLQVPYEDKEMAKANGARWDATVRMWFCTKPSPKLKQWMPKRTETPQHFLPTPVTSSPPAKAEKKSKVRRGNAQEAARLQISDGMTVSQLQDECRYRGIKGLSGKSKAWLLKQLAVGTIWLSHPSLSVPSAKSSSPIKPKKSSAISASKQSTIETATSCSSAKKMVKKESNIVVKTGPTKTAKKVPASKKRAATDASSTCSAVNWAQAPRITSKLTVLQLTHELMKRDPTAKGLSSKSKSWFLTKLGENSVWTTSPSINPSHLIDAPIVSKSLKNWQLMHEIRARTPDTKGLSSKSKDDLLNMVGIGSIWTTGPATDKRRKTSRDFM